LPREHASPNTNRSLEPPDSLPMLASTPTEDSSTSADSDDDEDADDSRGLVELALLARLKGQSSSPEEQECNLGEAVEHILWSLDVSRHGTRGVREGSAALPWGALAHVCCALLCSLLALVLLLALTRASFQELSLEEGVLLARSAPAFSGEEPLAATAKLLEHRVLIECASLPALALRALHTVAVVHAGEWRSLRIARVLRFGAVHLWLESADGTGIRLHSDKAFFREGKLGDEEQLSMASKDQPVAFFDVALTKA